MRISAARGWAFGVVLAALTSFVGPLAGVASALVGPVRLPFTVSQEATEAPAPSESAEPSPEEAAPSAQSHGCGEGGEPAALAECANTATTCAQNDAEPQVCGDPLAQAAAETVPSEPPGGDPESPCQEGTPDRQLACAVGEVQDRACEEEDEDADACTAVSLVANCLDVIACEPGDVVAPAAEGVCEALGAQEPADEETDSCEEQLQACAEPNAEECEDALAEVQRLAREAACPPASAQEPACTVATQVEALVGCVQSPACAFQAVWDGATQTICSLVGGEGCEETLDTCDDPADPDGGCGDVVDYLRHPARASACEAPDAACVVAACSGGVGADCADAVHTSVVSALCAVVAENCPDEAVPDVRDCMTWGGAAPIPDPICVGRAVIDVICGANPACVLRHQAVTDLLAAADTCQDPAQGAACQDGVRKVAVAALCANPATCIDGLAKCNTLDAPGATCVAMALWDKACGPASTSCPAELKALGPCLTTPAPCAGQSFLRTWLGDACVARGSLAAATLCPRQAEVAPPRVVPGTTTTLTTDFVNGSSLFPFRSVQAAVDAIEDELLQAPAVNGAINIAAGTYGRVEIFESQPLTFQTPEGARPVIDGGAQAGLKLPPFHQLTITHPVIVTGSDNGSRRAIAGPVSGVDATLASGRVYVDDWNQLTVTYGNAEVPTPEQTELRLRIVDGAVDPIVQNADGLAIPQTSGAYVLGTGAGLFGGTASVRLGSDTPAYFTLAVELVGAMTGAFYAGETVTMEVVVPQAPPVPPPGVPRTPEDDVPPAVRISGEDRSATAAAVSRASYPDGAEEVFVATGQSYADALSAGPAAVRSDSPVVLVERDRVPESTGAELDRLKPQEVRLMGGTSAIGERVEHELAAMGLRVERVRGSDRYATAAAVSSAHFPAGVSVAYIASGEGFADALSGGAAAAALGGPVLLVQPNDLPSSTAEELRRLRPARVVVLGGRQAVSDEVAAKLRELTGEVRRVSGATRYATSAAVSRDAFAVAGGAVYVATGETFPDALAGVPAAGAQRAPLMLVEPDRLPPEIAAELDRLRPKRIVILGGERSVTQRLERELRSYQVP